MPQGGICSCSLFMFFYTLYPSPSPVPATEHDSLYSSPDLLSRFYANKQPKQPIQMVVVCESSPTGHSREYSYFSKLPGYPNYMRQNRAIDGRYIISVQTFQVNMIAARRNESSVRLDVTSR